MNTITNLIEKYDECYVKVTFTGGKIISGYLYQLSKDCVFLNMDEINILDILDIGLLDSGEIGN